MIYEVIHYCHILPAFTTKAKGLTLEEAELKVKELYNKKKGQRHPMACCKYFIQPEDHCAHAQSIK